MRVSRGLLSSRGFLTAMLVILIGATLVAQERRPASVNERLEGAGRVVVARARSVESRWQESSRGDRLIVSRVVLDVEETLKGDPTSTAFLDLEGGTIDGITLRVSSLPAVTPGERGVFFLDQVSPGVHTSHRRGEGILKLDDNDVVRGSSVRLSEIRTLARSIQQRDAERAR